MKVIRKQKDLVVKIFGNTPTVRCRDNFEAIEINLLFINLLLRTKTITKTKIRKKKQDTDILFPFLYRRVTSCGIATTAPRSWSWKIHIYN